MPREHPLWDVMNGMRARNDKCKIPLFPTGSSYQEVIEGKKGVEVYSVSPFSLPLWHELRNFAFLYDEVEAQRTYRRLLQKLRQN